VGAHVALERGRVEPVRLADVGGLRDHLAWVSSVRASV
jgi:hypothetical protein